MQSGAYAGRHIRHQVEGGSTPKPFRYVDLGSAAYLTRGRALVSAGPVHLSGRLGWLTWLFIHIAFLTGYRNRVGAVLTWAVTFARDSRKERIFPTRRIESLRNLYAAPDRRTAPGATG